MPETENKQGSQFYNFTTTRPVAILMVVIGVCVFGWISYQQLPVNLMPDISYPSLTVRTEYEGSAPEEIETTISRPVEQALGIVNNLVSISSISKAGQSDVKLEFTWDTDMNLATADVREKLDQVFLPQEAKRPIILRFDPTLDPIMRFGLFGEASLIYLRHLADEEIKRALETVEGVAAVKIKGGLEEEIRVDMSEQQLTLIGIDIQQVRDRLSQENVNLAGGNLKEGQTEYLVRTMNEFKSVAEVGEVVIGAWNGKEIKVRDVAKVSRSFQDREIITRINNVESVEVEIFKEADANIVEVAQRVRDKVFGSQKQQEFLKNKKDHKLDRDKDKSRQSTNGKGDRTKKKKGKKGGGKGHGRDGPGGRISREAMVAKQMTNFITHNLPSNVKIDLLSDQSVFIKSSVDEVKGTAVIGGILAVFVLFIFLRNLSATAIIGISIPISIVATFAPLKMFGVSINIMSLGGLALGIGMLVDNSIVVLESIARCREEGDSLTQATTRGVSEVGGAVFASTLTTVAVFFPIVFVEGVAGQIFGDMALTVVFSLFASLAVALFLIPMLSSRQSSGFVQGLSLGRFQENIFKYKTAEGIDQLFDPENHRPAGQRIATGARLFFSTLLQLFKKIAQTFAALLLALAKQIIIFWVTLASPAVILLRLTGIVQFRISDWMARFAGRQELWGLQFAKQIWPDYLVNRSAPNLMQRILTFGATVRAASRLKSFLLAGFAVVVVPVYVLLFVLHLLLEIVFRIAHFILAFLAILVKGLVLMLKLLLGGPSRIILAAFNFGYVRLEIFYPKLLTRAMANRGAVLGSVTALFLFSLFIVGPRLGSELIPEVHQGEFNIEVTHAVGTPVEQTDARMATIQTFVQGLDGVKKIASVSGTDKSANSNSEEGEHISRLTVTIDEKSGNIQAAEERLVKSIRNEMRDYSGIKWKISRPVLFSFKTPIEVQIHGYSLVKLQSFASELEDRMSEIPGVIDVKSNIQRGNPEVQIVYNRPVLAQFGLNIRDVAAIIRNKVRGDIATEFREQDRKIDVRVRLQEIDRGGIDDLRRMVVNPGAPKPIPLEAVASLKIMEGPSEIRRVDQQRTAVVTANLSGRSLGDVSEDIFQELQAMSLPEEFTFTLAGQNKEMETSLGSLKLALALAIFLVYIVMASQFESMIHPLIIIFTIPLALIGVILWLFAFSIPLSIVVFLGMIMLAGIVVNNAIVLVDYINKLRERGVEKMDAILQAGRIRLRPIMMTTATTVLGLLPMALGLGDGAEIRTPMAITVIIGLLSATALTLVIIPTAYSFVDRETKKPEAGG